MTHFHNALFVPHGAPTFALNPGSAGAAMLQISKKLSLPRAIVVVSPHWDSRLPSVGYAPQLETIHDFYGFPAELYDIVYPARGSLEVAQEVTTALQEAGFQVASSQHGLDHGAWQPLRHMFPDAQVPVVPLSMQIHAGPLHSYRIGQALSELTESGVWVVASGNLTHNLRDWQMASALGGGIPDYVQRFTDWLEERLEAQDLDSLLRYRELSADGRRAHPGEDHLLPLFLAWGAAGPNAQPQAFFRGINNHVIAMDGYAFVS